jgi:hypothetical protein
MAAYPKLMALKNTVVGLGWGAQVTPELHPPVVPGGGRHSSSVPRSRMRTAQALVIRCNYYFVESWANSSKGTNEKRAKDAFTST